MPRCMFYACQDEGTVDARFVNEVEHLIDGKVCPAHDRFSQQGGELAILYQRVLAQPPAIGYADLPAPVPGNPPTTGGQS